MAHFRGSTWTGTPYQFLTQEGRIYSETFPRLSTGRHLSWRREEKHQRRVDRNRKLVSTSQQQPGHPILWWYRSSFLLETLWRIRLLDHIPHMDGNVFIIHYTVNVQSMMQFTSLKVWTIIYCYISFSHLKVADQSISQRLNGDILKVVDQSETYQSNKSSLYSLSSISICGNTDMEISHQSSVYSITRDAPKSYREGWV